MQPRSQEAPLDFFSNIGDPQTWLLAAMNVIVFILCLSVHEYAHARVAFALGDDTAARLGRLTLNPVSHIDPIGTIVLPIVGSISSIPVIGWAKPVPFSPNRLTRRLTMRTGSALVSVAGPASNLLMALACMALFWLFFASGLVPRFSVQGHVNVLLYQLIRANVGLAIFNMLPIPPLDGHRLLPRSLDSVVEFLGRYSFLAIMALIIFAPMVLSFPMHWILVGLFALFGMDYTFFAFGQ